jgi:hypothetical protein
MAMIELPPDDDPLSRIRADIETFDVPDDFNPITASDEALELYGFPPRPDADASPELHAFWVAMFSPPLEYVDIEIRLALPRELMEPGSGAIGTRTHHEGSLNWSGAYVTPRDGQMFNDVTGAWYVPAVFPPPGGSPTAMYGSSTWVGLDGQRSYFHSTLPQVGTGQFLNLPTFPPGSTTMSWFQWWPELPITIPARVVPGDFMMAWAHVLDPIRVLMVLVNASRRWLAALVWRAPRYARPPLVPGFIRANVSGATAEWVMERPAVVPFSVLFDLPDYSPVTFRRCYAARTLVPGGPWLAVQTVENPRLIRMYRDAFNPRRTVTTSVARRVSATRVMTFYQP